MKKVLLTMIAGLGFGLVVNAQSTDKGAVMLGGNVSYEYSNVVDVDGNTQTYSIIPQVGYFVKDNLAIGLGIGYLGGTEVDTQDIKSTLGEFTAAPFVRQYAGQGPVKFFGQLSVPMGWGNAKVDGTEIGTSERYGVAISPGLAYFPSSKIGIELSVKGLHYEYSSIDATNGGDLATNSFGLNANSWAPSIGVNFYF